MTSTNVKNRTRVRMMATGEKYTAALRAIKKADAEKAERKEASDGPDQAARP